MRRVILGAVGYLNARPLVFGLDRSPRFIVRYDLPSECARLLQAGDIDVGMIPSIEFLQGDAYGIVPDLAIASVGRVASVALYTTRPMADVRSIVMDASSRTSVALVRVLCARLFKIQPTIQSLEPDLPAMLTRGDAALLIGDNALLLEDATVRLPASTRSALRPGLAEAQGEGGKPDTTSEDPGEERHVQKIDLGEAWTSMTGLPFVWAFWAGRADRLTSEDIAALQAARDAGVGQPEAIAREYFRDAPQHRALGARYLRDNIKYYLGDEERAGLEAFYRYAVEIGVAPGGRALSFF